ncbi:MAG: hypothetical protein LBS91_03730, partial [Clostridiales Family XIII bacterium]|nr:hypothetical protein [Clostridiales Family XIII bacterium]
MKGKKLAAVILILAMAAALALSACGGAAPADTGSGGAAPGGTSGDGAPASAGNSDAALIVQTALDYSDQILSEISDSAVSSKDSLTF